ncbi:MAG: ABC transporter ATP-binding protein [Deferrisomatales bacterium]|nr:ABC transporter ATP-binding protein [Deferrisomatales bacterium]
MTLGSAFQLAGPWVLRDAIDSLRDPAAAGLLARYTLVFVALAVGQGLFKFLSRRLFLGGARRVEHDLRGSYFGRLIRLPAARLQRGRRGDFVSRATHDLQDIRLFLGAGALNFLQTVILISSATVLLWRIHPLLTFVALLPFPVVSVLVHRYSPRLHRRYLKANEQQGELSAMVQEALAGVRVVRAYHREAWQQDRFEDANRAVRETQAAVVRAWALLFPMVGMVAGLGHIAVLGLGGAWLARGSLTLGDFVAFNAYLAMLTWPMVALGWTLSLVQRGAAALDRLREVLQWPFEARGNRVPLPDEAPRLTAHGVSFAYEESPTRVLRDVDLDLPAGSFRGLVGATGSGKSTLVGLLARLRQPDAGSILLHDVPMGQVEERALRDLVALVPQEDFFFADSVAHNVCLGRPREAAGLSWALETAGLAVEVAEMPQGADSLVGEGGITLSGGQRQRLAIARALYGRPRFLLLDSALSSLDTGTSRRVLSSIRRALPEAALLVVSHRGAEVDEAEEVAFLSGGTIVARGRHRDLLETHPGYLRLYREEELRRELAEAPP